MSLQAENELDDSVGHLFRRHSGQMVSVLSRIFGLDRLDLIEDAVQDAMVAAMKKWPFTCVPDNPLAWLTQVAKNRIFDQLRQDSRSVSEEHLEIANQTEPNDDVRFEYELPEDQLRMIFSCCHPAISPDSQVALTLKIVGGFGVSEIARAYLSNTEAVAKMLTRAKRTLRSKNVRLEIPVSSELDSRLDVVLKVLYLMFNEGYSATAGDELVRKDQCFEAIRLARILTSHPLTSKPKVHALLALFLFQGARLSARSGAHGELILLADQDRSLWDKKMLRLGLRHFRISASGADLSDYHLEAEIAATHSLAAEFESTDWRRILECYNNLQHRRFSAVTELNRIVAIEKLQGIEPAFVALTELEARQDMSQFNLHHVTRAHLLTALNETAEAKEAYDRALELTNNQPLRRFLMQKIELLESKAAV